MMQSQWANAATPMAHTWDPKKSRICFLFYFLYEL